jgi:hypothetical protein
MMTTPTTALSPEWDRGFDEAFTDLVNSDAELVRGEFDTLIAAAWQPPSQSNPATSPTPTPFSDPPRRDDASMRSEGR